jgi:branched-chain amino acid transport system substrate-binding protein
MSKRSLLKLVLATFAGLCISPLTSAQDNTIRIGLLLPMTGPFASTGKQIEAAVKL